MEDLSLIGTEELIKELLSRYDEVVICGHQYKDEERTATDVFVAGSALPCIGLLEYAKRRIFSKYDETEYDRTE